ncbi:putative ribonuclease H-like domain-containing protein [Tanacetum coccineum]
MQDELLQFKLQKVWTLVDLPYGKRKPLVRKWGDYDEVFAPVARIKAIRLFLAYASFMNFIVYQMDVKRAFCDYHACDIRMEDQNGKGCPYCYLLKHSRTGGNIIGPQSMATLMILFPPQGTIHLVVPVLRIAILWGSNKLKLDRMNTGKNEGMKILLKSLHSIKLIFHPNGNFLSIPSCNALVLRLQLGMNLVALWNTASASV